MQRSNRTPWLWIPTLYLAEGIPYFMVNTIALVIFKDLGMDNGTLGLITSLISLPWVIKPLWGPFVDILRTKRWWILSMQALMTAAFLLTAVSIPRLPSDGSQLPLGAFSWCLILFCLTAFASATHDISADGFYMLALDEHRQAAFVGIRNTFYRIASVFGQGVLVVIAGLLERRLGNVSTAWTLTLVITAAIFAAVTLYHVFVLPRPASDISNAGGKDAGGILSGFGASFASFFTSKGIWVAMAFMLLYRLPEALSLKMLYPFFSAPVEDGGLSLGKEAYGLIYGTFGVVALLLGGILGGLCASRKGLRSCLWPMALSLALPCSVYLFMALCQPSSLLVVGSCIVADQFGYGFGFTAYTLYMMYFASSGKYTTSHYAICTGFMALSMMLPGMISGYLQQMLGYRGFFGLVMVCCLATFAVTEIARRHVAPGYGKKAE